MDIRARLRGVPPWLPIALLIIVGLVCIGTPLGALKPTPASLMSVGLGFVAGTALRVQRRCVGPVIGWYAGWQLLVPLLLGRPVPAVVTAVLIGTITVVALTLAGRAIGLRRLAEPADVLRLTLLALLAAVILPLLAAIGAQQLGIDTDVAGNLAQAMLAGAAGVVVGGGFALTFRVRRPGHVTGPRVLESVGLVVVAVLLLVGVTTYQAHSIAGSGPLIVLIVALGWAAMRFGPRISAALVAVSALWIATITVRGWGVFADTERSRIDALLSAQGYIVVTSIGILTLAVHVQRIRTQDAEAGRSAEILYNALDGAAAQMFLKRYDRATDRFVYFDVNDALAATLDLTPADFLGRASEDLYEEDLARRFREQDDEILRTGTRLRFDTTWVVRGNVTSNMTTMFPLRDAAGEVIGVGGVSLDRTEEIHREQMLQLVFNRSPVPTARLQWLGDGLGDVIEVNPAFADLLGVAAQDIEGRPLSDVVSTTELSGATLPTRGTDQREVRLRRRDGVELTVLVTGTLVGDDEPGQEPFLLIIVQDVTDTRAAEAGLVHRATHDPLTDLLNRQALGSDCR